VRALSEQLRLDGSTPISGEDVAFRLAPRINAPGRIGSPDVALQLLRARSLELARPLAAEIERLTQRRRELGDGCWKRPFERYKHLTGVTGRV